MRNMDSLPADAIEFLHKPRTLEEQQQLWRAIEGEYKNPTEATRLLVKADLYYLLVCVCGRKDMLNDFAFARCREVEAAPDGHVDLWARGHFKSSTITFGL